MHHLSAMPLRVRTKYGRMAQKMCSKERAIRGILERRLRNRYIKEEDAWRHFFAEINNNYIEEEITWAGTLT